MAKSGMIVGIDLGTTHVVVGYADPRKPEAVTLLPIAQLVEYGQHDERPLLPSSLFAPLPQEEPAEEWLLDGWIAGVHARRRAAEVVHRGVTSAKSWLCHHGVDRRAAILPWKLRRDDDDDAPRLSPLQASALLLQHVQRVWDARLPKRPLASQTVVLTVPASFDAAARALTLEAAKACGLEVRLLEEPQAAFYDAMRCGGDAALDAVLGERSACLALVCDVGGGTTDLSLIHIKREEAGIQVERVAVGEHLLLGGDNMDLALAHLCEQRLDPDGEGLPARRYAELVAACRGAKERLLQEDAPESVPITLLATGSKLIGGSLRTELSRDEVRQIVLEGFFPAVAADAEVQARTRTGMIAFGLPYARDVAITRHIAAFLAHHSGDAASQAGEAPALDALLLNGGVFHATAIRERLLEVLGSWYAAPPQLLQLTDPDTSVALGAVSYGLALAGRRRQIRGGAGHSYFLSLSEVDGRAQLLCVLPKGTPEDAPQQVAKPPLELQLGRSVRFEVYVSNRAARLGELLLADEQIHQKLPPLLTQLPRLEGRQRMPVLIEASLSSVGTLDVACVELEEPQRRFSLEFELRANVRRSSLPPASRLPSQVPASMPPASRAAAGASGHGKRLDAALALLTTTFGKKHSSTEKEAKGLFRALEKTLGRRHRWDLVLVRALFDGVMRHHRGRRRSPEHERSFWMLAGYCLRPGCGAVGDEERSAQLMKLFSQRLTHAKEVRSWPQFWICWRRVAAGLLEPSQEEIRDVLDPFLAPEEKRLKKPKAFRNNAAAEMLDLAASLERVEAKRRAELGAWVVERTWTERDARLWAALGRIGGRIPSYGSAHHVVSAATVERWMDHLLREKWDSLTTAPAAAVAMCRITGDRTRDVRESTRLSVLQRLEQIGVDDHYTRPLREWVALDDSDRASTFGESLPLGLSLSI